MVPLTIKLFIVRFFILSRGQGECRGTMGVEPNSAKTPDKNKMETGIPVSFTSLSSLMKLKVKIFFHT